MPLTGITIGAGITMTPGFTTSSSYATALAVAKNSGGIAVYQWSDATGPGTKYADPVTKPASGTYVLFNPSGTAVAITSGNNIYVYPWNISTGFGTKYSFPSVAPGTPQSRPSWTKNLFGIAGAVSIDVYQWSDSTGFGTKYSSPSLGTNQPYSVAISPLENVIAITTGGGTNNSVRAWQFDLSTGFGTEQDVNNGSSGSTYGVWGPQGTVLATFKDSNAVTGRIWNTGTNSPGGLFSRSVFGNNALAWNSAQTVLFVVGSNNTPRMWAYPWNSSTGFGNAYSSSNLIDNQGISVAVSPTDSAVAAVDESGNLLVYAWNNSTGWGSGYNVSSIGGGNKSVAWAP